ncbi:MAG: hypothetical protein A2808_01375 [Candidatus Moranbacteria bacterium RIFCSPHIGHO2_01_FULL_55_24]|nr:MAG: hypothetical protein A2808_01375 [Candidatus Moranbacteria bacterium RIFCSPHIGHO2_01_FULL_55_24]
MPEGEAAGARKMTEAESAEAVFDSPEKASGKNPEQNLPEKSAEGEGLRVGDRFTSAEGTEIRIDSVSDQGGVEAHVVEGEDDALHPGSTLLFGSQSEVREKYTFLKHPKGEEQSSGPETPQPETMPSEPMPDAEEGKILSLRRRGKKPSKQEETVPGVEIPLVAEEVSDREEGNAVKPESAPEPEAQTEEVPKPTEAEPASVESLEKEKESVPARNLNEEIALRREEVSDMRRRFAEEDYEKSHAWKQLRAFFRMKSDTEEDQDTRYRREQYEGALTALQELELEQLKKSGLKGTELKHEMAALLRYFKFEEAKNLVATRTDVRMERKGLGGRALDAYERLGKAYNSLSRPQKFALAAACFAGAGALSLSGGAALGGAIVTLRRFMAGAGGAVTGEVLMQGYAEKRAEKAAEKEIDEELLALTRETHTFSEALPTAESFERLKELLTKDIASLDSKMQQAKRAALFRKGAAVTFGTGIAFASDILQADTPGAEATEPALAPETPPQNALDEAIAAEPAPDLADEAVPSPIAPELPAEGVPHAIAEGISDPDNVAQAVAETSPKALLAEHLVTAADSGKGLWGVLEARLPADMDPGEKARVIQALENAIANKLPTLSPEELQAAGFPSGDINAIHVGDTLSLEKILSPEETQAILDGKAVAALEAAGAEPVEAVAKTSLDLDTYLENHETPVDTPGQAEGKPENLLPENLGGTGEKSLPWSEQDLSARELQELSDHKAFFKEHPDLFSTAKEELIQTRMHIFETPEIQSLGTDQFSFGAKNLGGIKVDRVLRVHEHLLENPEYDYSRRLNPLHPSQMERLASFTDAAREQFGKAADLKSREDINSYTLRITTLIMRRRMADPDFDFKF